MAQHGLIPNLHLFDNVNRLFQTVHVVIGFAPYIYRKKHGSNFQLSLFTNASSKETIGIFIINLTLSHAFANFSINMYTTLVN